MCKTLKVLPGPGGYYDQDWFHVMLLKAGLHAIAIREEREMAKAKAEARTH